MSRLKRFAGAALAVLISGSTVVYAQEASLSDEQVQQRLAFITKALEDGQPAAKRWWYGWIGAYTAGALAGGVLAASHWHDTKLEGAETVPDREFAEGMLVGGATFALGVGPLVLDPFVAATAAKKLRPLPESSPLERRAKLNRAEQVLRECARDEKDGRGLKTQLLNVGANAAGAVVIKAIFHQSWGSALVSFAAGEAVSLLNIFSQPMKATRDLKRYEAGFEADRGPLSRARPEPQWSLGLFPGGISFRLKF